MDKKFNKYARRLDSEIQKLNYDNYFDSVYFNKGSEQEYFSNLSKKMKNILDFLGAKEIREESDTDGIRLRFKHGESSYSKLGKLGKRLNIRLDKNPEGVINMGFLLAQDYIDEEKGHIATCYDIDGNSEENLDELQNWRKEKGLGEFFNLPE